MSESVEDENYGPFETVSYPSDGLFIFKQNKIGSLTWLPPDSNTAMQAGPIPFNWISEIEWVGFYPYRTAVIEEGVTAPRGLLLPLELWCKDRHAEIKRLLFDRHIGMIENKWVGIFHERGNEPFAIYFKDDWAVIANGSCVKPYERPKPVAKKAEK